LTWRERVALRWDARSLELLDEVPFNREGWGICATGGSVLTSDGTSELVRRDTATLAPLGLILVRCAGERVPDLNDLGGAGGGVGEPPRQAVPGGHRPAERRGHRHRGRQGGDGASLGEPGGGAERYRGAARRGGVPADR